MSHRRCLLFLLASTLACHSQPPDQTQQAAITTASLFTPPPAGYTGRCRMGHIDGWCPQFGGFSKVGAAVYLVSSFAALPTGGHAEAQRMGVQGADFTYTSDVLIGGGAQAHLQFRITDEGRYGVMVKAGRVTLYQQLRRPDTEIRPGELTQNFAYTNLYDRAVATIVEGVWLRIGVTAKDGEIRFKVTRDGALLHEGVATSHTFKVGRFGIYASRPSSTGSIFFSNPNAVADVTASSNFALLYSPMGYELGGSKRVLVRSLNPLPASPVVDVAQSTFAVQNLARATIFTGKLQALPKTFGMDLWSADFTTAISTPGSYLLQINLRFLDGTPGYTFFTNLFEVSQRLLTSRVLYPLTVLNAAARYAGAEDRDGWREVAGSWTYPADGTLIAYNANTGFGSAIERIKAMGYGSLASSPQYHDDNIVVAQMAVINGCDAMLQFRNNGVNAYGITLQAGSAGGCPYLSGPGRIRLHQEGYPVDNGFQVLASAQIPQPFRMNHPYNLLVRSVWENGVKKLRVQLDGVEILQAPMAGFMQHGGSVGFKAWGGSARFTRLQMWKPTATLIFRRGIQLAKNWSWPITESDGEYQANVRAVDSPNFTPCDGTYTGVPAHGKWAVDLGCEPVFGQRHGYNDCNNYIGEAVSHGAFVAGLVDVWHRRATGWLSIDRARLKEAILVGVAYLKQLYDQAGRTGEYAHGEYGRGGVLTNLGWHQTRLALYGDAAFAELGNTIDAPEARQACVRAYHATRWLHSRNVLPPEEQALFYFQLATCAAREKIDFAEFPGTSTELQAEAIKGANSLLDTFPDIIQGLTRDTGRTIPWFEGVYKIRQAYGEGVLKVPNESLQVTYDNIAKVFTKLLAPDGNGFHVVPQASGSAVENQLLWNNTTTVPNPFRWLQDTDRDFYNVYGTITTATDMVFLGRLMPTKPELKKLAAAHLQWPMGLNPGIPKNKMKASIHGGSAWTPGNFIWGGPAPFARAYEGINIVATNRRGSTSFPWETPEQREVWWIKPVYNGFMSLMNGNMIWQGEWDYSNMGKDGWSSGETFILGDGIFVKAFIAYEDWINGQ